ncbi:MAG: nucleoside 2-deoxyribosyltransferase [bacterium]
MKIVLGCSMKYRDLVRDIISKLESLGLEPIFPNLNYSSNNKDDANTPEEKKKLAMEHYEAIEKADVVYLITPEGYMGTSCKLELGYAIAKGKPIYFSEPTNDTGLDCYVKKFIPINNLKLFLEI